MRVASVSLALAFALVSGACSDSKTTPADGGGVADGNAQFDSALQQDATQMDAAVQRDAPPANYDSGTSLVQCGPLFCDLAAGDECCVASGVTPRCAEKNTCGNTTIECDGPEDCYTTARPVCCGHELALGGGASCAAASECNTIQNVRVCRLDSDCDGTDKCCGAASVFALSVQFCVAAAACTGTAATPGVTCGASATCDAPDACCLTPSGGACGTVASCTGGLPLECDGPEDCQPDGGAQVCCGYVGYDGAITGGSACAATCPATGVISGTLCHSDADCPSTQTCRSRGYGGYTLRLCQ